MEAAQVIAAITAAISLASKALQAGQEAAPFAVALYENIFGKKDVTQEDLDALEARLDALSAELQAPLPPEDP